MFCKRAKEEIKPNVLRTCEGNRIHVRVIIRPDYSAKRIPFFFGFGASVT